MLAIMVLFLLIPLTQNVGLEIQKAKNMHKARSLVYLGMAALNVAFTFFMAPTLGYWASAIAYTSSIFLGNCLFMNWYYQTHIGLEMRVYWQAVAPIVVCSALPAVICLFGTSLLPVRSWSTFLVWGFVFSCLYLALVFAIVLRDGERAKLASLVHVVLHRGKK